MIQRFGTDDKPVWAAKVGPHYAPPDGAGDGNIGTGPKWCCPLGKGHPSIRAAAMHAVRLVEAKWASVHPRSNDD